MVLTIITIYYYYLEKVRIYFLEEPLLTLLFFFFLQKLRLVPLATLHPLTLVHFLPVFPRHIELLIRFLYVFFIELMIRI